MKEFAKKFYKSKAWQDCRRSYISKRIMIDGGMCEICKENTGYILHHKTELNPTNINDVNITLNHCNLQYVCKKCHDNIHWKEMHKAKQCTVVFAPTGEVIPIDNR